MRSSVDERIAVTGAAASMLTALTLCPLISGYTWLFVAAIVVVTMMVTGMVARQVLRWWPAVAAAQAVVLVFALMVLFARSRITEGPGVLKELFDAGMRATQDQAPPVSASQGVVLLAAGGTGLVALLVDLLASTLRQPALAGLPLLAVYCVPAALLDGGLPWYYFFVAASGFLLLLAADSGERVRGWGRVLTSSASGGAGGAGGMRASDGGMARGGRRVGVVTVLMAVALPAMVPGLSNQIIGGSGDGSGSGGKGRTITRINPVLDLRKDLNSQDDTPLLSYTSNAQNPEPLRIVTSDVFDGNTWAPSTPKIPRANKVQDGLAQAPGLGAAVKTESKETRITIGPLKETYLPLPYPATIVDVRGEWLYDAPTLNVIGYDVTTEHLSYIVDHEEVVPTAEQLADAPAPSSSVSSAYLNLPAKIPASITETAHTVAGTGTNYQMAVRLQRWFRKAGNFEYSEKAPTTKAGDSSLDAIVQFLKVKQGYCIHFASTMAVMARILGIPARVAVGFLPGEEQSDGSRVISSHDAHAWPELYFEGVGWVRFEPTPRAGQAQPPSWSIPPAGTLPDETQAPDTKTSAAPSASATAQTPKKKAAEDSAPIAAKASTSGQLPWRLVLILAIMVVTLSAPRAAVTLASRRRWSRAAGSPPALAEAAWDDLRLRLSDLGVRWAAAWTPRAVQRRLADDYQLAPATAAALDRLVQEIENARYAPPDDELSPAGRPGSERAADVAVVVRTVSATKSRQTRWQAKLWPSSGVSTLSRLGPWMNSTADRAGQQVSTLGSQVKEKVGSGRH